MLPTDMTPVLSPMPTSTGGAPWAARSAFSSRMACSMASAASTARRAWSGMATGAPQKAMTQSPMYLSMVPWCARMTCVSRVSTSFSSACKASGSRVSDKVVKPRRSQNMTVSSSARACML